LFSSSGIDSRDLRFALFFAVASYCCDCDARRVVIVGVAVGVVLDVDFDVGGVLLFVFSNVSVLDAMQCRFEQQRLSPFVSVPQSS